MTLPKRKRRPDEGKEDLAKQIEENYVEGEDPEPEKPKKKKSAKKKTAPWNYQGIREGLVAYNGQISGELKNRLSFLVPFFRSEKKTQRDFVEAALWEATNKELKERGFGEFLEDDE